MDQILITLRRFRQFDVNGDGVLTWREAASSPMYAPRFGRLDLNRDGLVERAEVRAEMIGGFRQEEARLAGWPVALR
jgi:hypothetical protein